MADSALIYLAPGAFQDALADARVLFQESRADSPRQGSLGEALEALSGRAVNLVVTSAERAVLLINDGQPQNAADGVAAPQSAPAAEQARLKNMQNVHDAQELLKAKEKEKKTAHAKMLELVSADDPDEDEERSGHV